MSWASDAVSSARHAVMQQAGATILTGLLVWPAVGHGASFLNLSAGWLELALIESRASPNLSPGTANSVRFGMTQPVGVNCSEPGSEIEVEPAPKSSEDVSLCGGLVHESIACGHEPIILTAFLIRSHFGRAPPTPCLRTGLRHQETCSGSPDMGATKPYFRVLSDRNCPVRTADAFPQSVDHLSAALLPKTLLASLLHRRSRCDRQSLINATGQVEFQFASSNGAALYRPEAR
jgi:hypothetical protein